MATQAAGDVETARPGTSFGSVEQHGGQTAQASTSETAKQHEPGQKNGGAQRKPIGAAVKHHIKIMVLGTYLNLLLPFAILGILARILRWNDGATFAFCLLGLMPLADRLCFITEQIVLGTTKSLGGLLNATFNNLTETLCVSLAVSSGNDSLARMFLLGSVLGSLFLVLGMSLTAGGARFREQRFSDHGAAVSMTQLLAGSLAIALLSIVSSPGAANIKPQTLLTLSRVNSILLILLYLSFLGYQLTRDRHLFEPAPGKEDAERPHEAQPQDHSLSVPVPTIGLLAGLLWLAVLTLVITVLSSILVATTSTAADALGLPLSFMAVVIVPLAGNLAENTCAVVFAYRGDLPVSLGICLGSALQILLFVAPYTVLYGWAAGQPATLGFSTLESAALVGAVLLVSQVLQGGRSDWLKGTSLLIMYAMLVAATWCVDYRGANIDSPVAPGNVSMASALVR
eukprot:jgi/Tetstr1/465773/TSEL_010398.t1